MELDFKSFSVLSFDCYGTLIDWETGILGALHPILRRHEVFEDDETLLTLYARFESEIEAGPYVRYRTVLRRVMRAFAKHFGLIFSPEEELALVRSLPEWPPFPDTVRALRELKSRYRLAILSNIDRDLFRRTAVKLRVPFDWIVTAEDVRSYKPSPANFSRALQIMNVNPSAVLHVAQSLYHDIAPARKIGLKTVWVNRRKGKPGSGATPFTAAVPDLQVGSLTELLQRIREAFPQNG